MARKQLGAAPAVAVDSATKGYVDTAAAGRAPASHNHTAAQTTSGVFDIARIPSSSVLAALGIYSTAHYGVVGNGVVDDTAAFRALVGIVPSGGTIVLPPDAVVRLTGSVSFTRPVTVQRGRFVSTAPGITFVVESDDVVLEHFKVQGPSSWATAVNRDQIHIGTPVGSTTVRTGVKVRDVEITQCTGVGVRLDWITRFDIDRVTVLNAQYAGIQVISGSDGKITNCHVENVVMGGDLVNSYGIAVTDSANTEAARSSNVVIDSNTVKNVAGWEGIDTHGGRAVVITNNVVEGCRTGIAVLVGNSARLMAPEDCVVSNNVVIRGNGAAGGHGITFCGRQDATLVRKASGAIGPNTIRGYETDVFLEVYDEYRTSLAHQSTDAAVSRGPSAPPFRIWTAQGTITIPASSVSASTVVAFPAAHFSGLPVVSVVKASGIGARFVPYTTGLSKDGVTVGMYDPSGIGTGAGATLTMTYDIIAIQLNPGATGRGRPYS